MAKMALSHGFQVSENRSVRKQETSLMSAWSCSNYSEVSLMSFLTQTDLVYTIGESAALGAAGVVLWGDMSYASSRVSISTHFGMFLKIRLNLREPFQTSKSEIPQIYLGSNLTIYTLTRAQHWPYFLSRPA